MLNIKLILLVIVLAISSCTKHEVLVGDPYAVGNKVISRLDNTVILITVNDHPDRFEGIIVDSTNPGQLCSAVGAFKANYLPCTACTNNC